MRLQACLAYPPPQYGEKVEEKPKVESHSHKPSPMTNDIPTPTCGPVYNSVLLNWVQRLQFKMGQIELQSSAATQFYPL